MPRFFAALTLTLTLTLSATGGDWPQFLGPNRDNSLPDVVEAWGAGLTPELYISAMESGEVFFIATGHIDGQPEVLGFSTHRVDDRIDGTSVYVRGSAARRGIGTTLLRLAEAHAIARGASSIHIQASLAGVAFYQANGFGEIGRGGAILTSGRSLPCVFMRKLLRPL